MAATMPTCFYPALFNLLRTSLTGLISSPQMNLIYNVGYITHLHQADGVRGKIELNFVQNRNHRV